jgi:DNA-directed RNA polymerase subunit RPC12/RpoP
MLSPLMHKRRYVINYRGPRLTAAGPRCAHKIDTNYKIGVRKGHQCPKCSRSSRILVKSRTTEI